MESEVRCSAQLFVERKKKKIFENKKKKIKGELDDNVQSIVINVCS